MRKTLSNIDVGHSNPVEVYGECSKWVLVCKAWCDQEKWMKSTKAMQLGGGCLVQVSTQQGDQVAEALTFVPGLCIEEVVK